MRLFDQAFCVFAVALLVSCGPPGAGGESSSGCRPNDVHVDVNDHSMVVSWKSECDGLISGYNIYINDHPSTEGSTTTKPFNATPFAGDTNPDDGIQHFEADNLENGREYYVSVRTIFADLSLTKPSEEIVVVCGPRGEIELGVRYSSEQDGFSLDSNSYVRADDLLNDLYFYSGHGIDYLASPVRLDGFLKDNRLEKLSVKGDLQSVAKSLISSPVTPEQQRVMVKVGDWVLLQTAQGSFALFEVVDIVGSGEKRRIRLFYAYTAIADLLHF